MSKYTVWMAGDGKFDSWNTKPRKFEDIEADDFMSACHFVWEYYHDGKEGSWILDVDSEHPALLHKRREWSYDLYPTEEDAYRATFEKIDAQKIATYRRFYDLPDDAPVCLKCWEKFAIPYLEDDGENVNITYTCYRRGKFVFYYEPKDAALSWRETINAQVGFCLSAMDACMNCQVRDVSAS